MIVTVYCIKRLINKKNIRSCVVNVRHLYTNKKKCTEGLDKFSMVIVGLERNENNKPLIRCSRTTMIFLLFFDLFLV